MADELKIIITATDRASSELKKLNGDLGGLSSTAKEMAGAFGVAMGVVAAGKAVVENIINPTVELAAQVRDLGRNAGISAEEASILLQVADDLKIPINSLEMAFKTMNKNGIQPSVANIKDLQTQYRLLKTPVEKAQFAMENFGLRAGPEMQKLLEQTPEAIDEMAESARRAGLIMDDEAVQAAREYEIALDNLEDSAKGLGITLGTKLIPDITKTLDLFGSSAEFVDVLSDAVNSGQITWIEAIGIWSEYNDSAADVKFAIEQLGVAEENVGATTGNFSELIYTTGIATEVTTTKILGLTGMVGNLSVAFDSLKASGDLLKNGMKTIATGTVEEERAKLNLLAATGKLTEAELNAGIEQIHLLENMENLNTALADGVIAEYDWFEAMADGKVTTEELNTALGYQQEDLTLIQQATGITAEAWADYKDDAIPDIGKVNAALEVEKGLVGDITQGIKNIPKQTTVYVDIVYREHGKAIPKQHGGEVEAERLYLIGEAGPELFIPDTDGLIVPNHQIDVFMGGAGNAGAPGGNMAGGGVYIGSVNVYAAPGMNGQQLFDEFKAELGKQARAARLSGASFVG